MHKKKGNRYARLQGSANIENLVYATIILGIE